ncbi:MAG: hypothetical protein WCI79_00575 [Candidatus Saccharibacteria bacterium]
MSKNEKTKRLVNSIARSMEAEGFNFKAVKKTLEKQLQRIKV